MKTLITAATLLVEIIFAAFSPANSLATANPSKFQIHKLKNGLEIIVVENHMTPIATVVYVAKNGSFTEPEEFAGLSHLYEHMFFKKNRVMASEDEFNEKNRELGMQNNASTAEEVVEYHFTMPAKNLQQGIQFMSDAIMAPAFDSGDIQREREVVLGEFDRDEASPDFPLSRALDSALWGTMTVRKEPLGQRPVIQSATPAKMLAIEHKFYVPNNSALLVSGDVNPEAVYAYAEKYLGSWQAGPPPFPKYDPPAFPPMETKIIIRPAPETPSVTAVLNYRGPSVGKDNASTYAADVFHTLINNATSRFYKDLVDSGLALSAGAGYSTQHNVGPITVVITATPEKAKAAIRQMWGEIAAWKDPDYFTDKELASAKEQLSIRRLYDEENPTAFVTSSVTSAWAITGVEYYENYIKNVKAVTRADIQAYLQKYIYDQPYALGIEADQKILAKLNIQNAEVAR